MTKATPYKKIINANCMECIYAFRGSIDYCRTKSSQRQINITNINQNLKEVLPMNKYEKPQLEIKSLIQTLAVSTEDEDANSVSVTIPGSRWPF